MIAASFCSHLARAERRDHGTEPGTHGSAECLASHSAWVHLRLCLHCGHVGCCDESPNRHATRHYHETHHPVIRSFEPGELWAYCYPDDSFVMDLQVFQNESAPRHYDPPLTSGFVSS